MKNQDQSDIGNADRILQHIWLNGPLSRADLSRELGMDKSTVTKISARLVQHGLIIPVGKGSVGSLGGRRPVNIDIARETGAALGIEFHPDGMKLCYTDMKGGILHTEICPCPEYGSAESLERLTGFIRPDYKGVPVRGIGLAVPESLEYEVGRPESASFVTAAPAAPADYVHRIFGIPAWSDTGANCCAWGGLLSLPELSEKDFAVILGTRNKQSGRPPSIAFGFCFGGRVYRGSHSTAGKFRSIFCDENDPGQLKTAGSLQYSGAKPLSLTDEMIIELCRNTAFTANLLDLDAILIAGCLTDNRELLTRRLQQEFARNRRAPALPPVHVRHLPEGISAPAYGAAALALYRVMGIPAKKPVSFLSSYL